MKRVTPLLLVALLTAPYFREALERIVSLARVEFVESD